MDREADTYRQPLGIVTQGSLSKGLEVRLHAGTSVEDVRVGKFVVIEGRRSRFFSMLTDVALGAADPAILLDPPDGGSFLGEALEGIGTFGTTAVQPMLMLEHGARDEAELRPVKTVPTHFAPVFEATDADFASVFGSEDDPQRARFFFGRPLDMDTPVCLDLERFVERSNGIFGKSGTGKSFLTRLVLCGVIKRQVAVNLIFDMHNEYGWEARSENRGQARVKGLQQLFGTTNVTVFTLDPESTSRRGISGASDLLLGLNQIEIEDLELLSHELNLADAGVENAMLLRQDLGPNWMARFLQYSPTDIKEHCETHRGHPGSMEALQRKLNRIARLPYVRPAIANDSIEYLVRHLREGRNVIIEFGAHNSALSYMLATNLITRRIHEVWQGDTERYLREPGLAPPRKLMITIEEAHKFLAPAIARQTIFGTIAREMRKYNVTLLIVDQRPSGIDNEVLSQVGTRITALLNDDKDIDAVFTGVSGGQNLRTVLAQLDPKQQALVLGYAVPMPVVVRTRDYDEAFYAAMSEGPGLVVAASPAEKAKKGRDHLKLWDD